MQNLAGKRALFVLTSVNQFPGTDRLTGFYMDEMAIPYWALRDAGVAIDFASIMGGEAPIDPKSLGEPGNRQADVQRFLDDDDAMQALRVAAPVSAADIDRYDGIFLPGGHGTMWDFAQSDALALLVGAADDRGMVIGAVCHGPAGLIAARRSDGSPVVSGKRINSFTDAEEIAVGLAETVPYMLESALRRNGALFESNPENFQPHAVRDDTFVTGQNPASAPFVAALLLEAFAENTKTRAA